MTISTLATAEKALKEYFIGPIRTQLDEKSGPFLSLIEKSTEEVSGYKIKMPLKYGRSGGVGNRAEDADLPTPSPRKYAHAEWQTKNIFGRIMLTDKLMKASRDDRGAFAKQLAAQMEDIANDANNDLRRQLFGDGTGKMATTTVNTATATLVVDTVQYIAEGQLVDVRNADGTLVAGEREVLVRDSVNSTITISGAVVTTLATDIITVAGNFNNEITGLKAIFTPGTTLYGINRATEKWFNPNIKDNAAADIDEIVMQQMIDEADAEMGSTIDFIMASYGVARGFQYNQLTYKKNIEYMDIKGGYKTMAFAGVPIAREKYETPGTMRFLSKNNFKLFRMGDWDWLDADGAVLSRVSGKPAYEATLVMYADLGCDKVRGQSILTNIKER